MLISITILQNATHPIAVTVRNENLLILGNSFGGRGNEMAACHVEKGGIVTGQCRRRIGLTRRGIRRYQHGPVVGHVTQVGGIVNVNPRRICHEGFEIPYF